MRVWLISCLLCRVFLLFVTDMGRDLGMQAIHGRMTHQYLKFKHVLDRINARFEIKEPFFAGRVTRVQSVLTSIPYYSMQTAAIPVGVCHEIERISRKCGVAVTMKNGNLA